MVQPKPGSSTPPRDGEVRHSLNGPTFMADKPASSRYYTAGQIFLGAVIAGPVGGGYFVAQNHALLGTSEKARAVLMWSVVAFACLIGLSYIAPLPYVDLFIALVVARFYRSYAEKTFLPLLTRGGIPFSWWRALGLSLAILIVLLGSMILIILALPKMALPKYGSN
jgi:hypothetical protein